MLKRTLAIALAVTALSLAATPVQAHHFDFAFFGHRHSVDVIVGIEDFDLVALVKSQGNHAIVPLDSRGDMTATGDFELEETGRSYSEIAIGYKSGPLTLFAGYGTQGVLVTERTIVENEITGKKEAVAKNTKDTDSGVIFGVNLDAKIERIGILATLAKGPGGLYSEAKFKYYISNHLALLGGGIYHPGVNATGVIFGLGISY